MKNLVFIITYNMLCIGITYAQENRSCKFTLNNGQSIYEHIGDTVLYYNNFDPLLSSYVPFVIHKIKYRPDRNGNVSILLRSLDGRQWRHLNATHNIPLVLYNEFKKAKEACIGTIFTNPKVKASYECIDIEARGKYIFKNSLTGDTKKFESMEDAELHCFDEELSVKYTSNLISIEKSITDSIRYGVTETIPSDSVMTFRFKDEFMDMLIFHGGKGFSFSLTNISDHTIRIIWDEAVFVNFDGKTSKVIHNSTRYIDRFKEQQPTVIIKGATTNDVAVPVCTIRDGSDGVEVYSIYPDPYLRDKFIGSTFRLMLPIQIKDTVNEYIFTFELGAEYRYPELLNL